MNIGLLPKRYAKALLEYAQRDKVAKQVCEEMQTLYLALTKENLFRKAMSSPTLGVKEKKKLLIAAVPNAGEHYQRFISLVLKNRRESCLKNIALVYNHIYNESIHVCAGVLTTAVEAPSALKNKVEELFKTVNKDSLELKNVVDPSIEGGFIFDFDTYRIDASVKTQLQTIKQQLTQSTYSREESPN